MPNFKINKAGPLSLIQDAGRKNVQHLGISQCGAMDQHAFNWANKLLNNTENAAVIESTFGLLKGTFSRDTKISLSGAQCNAKINNIAIANWSSHRVKAKDVLTLNGTNSGMRSYLAIHGGFQTHKAQNSRSMHPKENWDKNLFNALNDDMEIEYSPINKHEAQKRNRSTPWYLIPNYDETLFVNVYPSYQFDQFDQKTIETFTHANYTITADSNRMGVRLQGEAIEWHHPPITSEPIAYGSIQIPPNGQPIILLNDRQTLGGYPKIGCAKKEDCWKLSQRRPNQKVGFKFIGFD